jgi:probable F420-dependent oxidoreductase
MFANTGAAATGPGARQLAVDAEAAGIESLWTVEHVVVPSGYQSAYPYDSSGKMAGGAEDFDLPDPLVWLSYVAAVTERIKLATGILILPQRNPLITAKAVASIDAMSGGRMILGVGVGWLREEFDAIGVPFADRGRRHDDYVEAMRELWGGEKTTVHNTYASFDNCISRPRPANGTVPIVIGGHTEKAARRAGRLGDGFFPGQGGLDELAGLLRIVHEECVANGRDPNAVELTASAGGRSIDEVSTRVEQLVGLGASRVVLPPMRGDRLAETASALGDRFGLD